MGCLRSCWDFVKSTKFKIYYGLFGAFLGAFIFVYFGPCSNPANWFCAFFGLTTVASAFAWVGYLYLLLKEERLEKDPTEDNPSISDDVKYDSSRLMNDVIFQKLVIIECTILNLALLAIMIYCYVYAGLNHQLPDPNSAWVTAVWVFMTMKWLIAMTFDAYRRIKKLNAEANQYETV
eukprot:TRINITY_DN3961_c0_g1_i1.p1 TRINITY_DN3961_c0_g1~~TRINITY_DN3961_c0_g1_i1.p1  ORF type:complete len:194 (+),score=46.44 TRINITY_DN3961_c0_g1_i1:51-584(+)